MALDIVSFKRDRIKSASAGRCWQLRARASLSKVSVDLRRVQSSVPRSSVDLLTLGRLLLPDHAIPNDSSNSLCMDILCALSLNVLSYWLRFCVDEYGE